MPAIENNQSGGAGRYAYIDVLRGLAVLLVLYQHTAEFNLNPAVPINWLEQAAIIFFTKTIGVGEIGVCIFFMISGFVVPFSLLRYQHNPIRNFVAHRFFRLYPAYWLSVPLGLVFVSWRFGAEYGGRAIDWPTVLINLSMLQEFVGVDNLMGHYWTLPLELLFYLLCAALFAWRRLDSFKTIMLLLIGFFVLRELARHVPSLEKNAYWILTTVRYLGLMFFGLFYRKWLLERDSTAGRQAIWLLVLTSLTFGLTTDIRNFYHGDMLALRAHENHLIALAIFFVFTRVHRPTSRIGSYLGKISYSIYLFHAVVFYPLFFYWFQASPLHAHPHLFIVLSALLSIAFSALTFHYIEQPCIELGRKHFTGEPKPGRILPNSA